MTKSAPRDEMASLKILGALLRLDALKPGGFTAADLANDARAELETARAFLKPDKGPGYTEQIWNAKVTADSEDGRGRPANLYRLLPTQRATLLQHLVDIRREIDAVQGVLPAEDVNKSPLLELLEATLDQLELQNEPADSWLDRLAEARSDIESATKDLRALQLERGPDAAVFARKLDGLKSRLAALEPQSVPVPSGAMESIETDDPILRLVEQFGRWLGGQLSSALDPVIVILDGIRGHDQITTSLVDRYQAASMRVAAFNVAKMPKRHRRTFYASLDRLRTATPLAVADLVLTVDGRTDIASSLATEFRDLSRLGAWQSVAKVSDYLDVPNSDELRRSYLNLMRSEIVERRATSGTRKTMAAHVTSCLAALTAAEHASLEPISLVHGPELHKSRLLDAAQQLMGRAVCFDITTNMSIGETFADAPVEYIPQALEALEAHGRGTASIAGC